MRIVAIALIITSLVAVVSIILYCTRWLFPRKDSELELIEPDLEMVDKPEIIGKVPENETEIPDANSPFPSIERKSTK